MLELTDKALSLNVSLIASFSSRAVSATCVSVTSLSAPKPRTAESLSSLRSLLTVTAVEAFRSIVASPSIHSTPSDDCCKNVAVSPNCIFSVDATSISSENSK